MKLNIYIQAWQLISLITEFHLVDCNPHSVNLTFYIFSMCEFISGNTNQFMKPIQMNSHLRRPTYIYLSFMDKTISVSFI